MGNAESIIITLPWAITGAILSFSLLVISGVALGYFIKLIEDSELNDEDKEKIILSILWIVVILSILIFLWTFSVCGFYISPQGRLYLKMKSKLSAGISKLNPLSKNLPNSEEIVKGITNAFGKKKIRRKKLKF